MTQPANFETLLGGFVPPSSVFSKPQQKANEVEVGAGVLNKGGLRSEFGSPLHGRGRGGRQLSKGQV